MTSGACTWVNSIYIYIYIISFSVIELFRNILYTEDNATHVTGLFISVQKKTKNKYIASTCSLYTCYRNNCSGTM